MQNIEISSGQISRRGDALSVQLQASIGLRWCCSFGTRSDPGESGQAIRDRSGHLPPAVQRGDRPSRT